jgi:hypothetical protein
VQGSKSVRLNERRWRHCPGLIRVTLIGSAACWPIAQAHGQLIENYFPTAVPGYDQELGIAALSSVRPLYQPGGLRAGSFTMNGGLDESFGYNDNLLGLRPGQGSWLVETAPSLTIDSDWSRNRVGANISVDDYRYLDLPGDSHTNYTAAVGGGYMIDRGELDVGYAHLSEHQLPTEVGAAATSTPVPYTVDNLRAQYRSGDGPLRLSPDIEVTNYQYGTASILGVPSDQSFRNRYVVDGGIVGSYDLAEQRTALIVVRGFSSQFDHVSAGSPSQSSKSALVLAGFDYQYDGVWRYRALIGMEARFFDSSAFHSQVAVVGQGQVVWTPTNLLTLTATASRTIEDPSEEASSGFTYTTIGFVADYEFMRNVLLEGNAGMIVANNLQGSGTQTSYSGGAKIIWLLNRRWSVSASYDHTSQNGSLTPSTSSTSDLLTTGTFNQNVVLISLHLRL